MKEHERDFLKGPPNTPSYPNLASPPPPTSVHTNNKPRIQNGRLTKSQHRKCPIMLGGNANNEEVSGRQTGGKHFKHSLNLSHMEVI